MAEGTQGGADAASLGDTEAAEGESGGFAGDASGTESSGGHTASGKFSVFQVMNRNDSETERAIDPDNPFKRYAFPWRGSACRWGNEVVRMVSEAGARSCACVIDRHMVGEVRQSLETLEKEQEMRETAGQTVHRRKGDSPKLRMRRGKLSVRSIAALAATCIVLVALPIISWAAGIEPSYTWYTNHDAGDDTYVLSNESDYAGFVSFGERNRRR